MQNFYQPDLKQQPYMNKYNFSDLLSKEITINDPNESRTLRFAGIEIPMIQRDYAQGRAGETEVRRRFLDALFKALNEKAVMQLDFVYGSVRINGTENYFVPLDGQQRLTTLYLLHWYIGNRELSGENLETLRQLLKKFSYATRPTARVFCEKLADVRLSFKTAPSSEIQDSGWFYGAFKKDPTVQAMLIMLDAIHDRYNDNSQLFQSLSDLTFYILPLDGFNLSDELYIKMNARGKQLTDFENLKADLTNWMQSEINPLKAEFKQEVTYNNRYMPFAMAISLHIDNDWTNLFWNYLKTDKMKQRDKVVDLHFIHFLNRYLLNEFIVSSPLPNELVEKDRLFTRFYGKDGNEDYFRYRGFEDYRQILQLPEVLRRLYKGLNQLTIYYEVIKDLLRPSWAPNDRWELLDENIIQRQRILLFAVMRYLDSNDFKAERFKEWMRVIWNIIADPDIRSIGAMIGVMRLVNSISDGAGDIYPYLLSINMSSIVDKRSVVKQQLAEERRKANLIIQDNTWEIELILAESHNLFMGNIGFLLQDEDDKSLFIHRRNTAFGIFNYDGGKNLFASEKILMRAAISRISQWNDLYNLNLGDNYENWQLLLRRNEVMRNIIYKFCQMESVEAIREYAKDSIKLPSQISDNNLSEPQVRRIHNYLYSNAAFFSWMQEKGAVNLKWANEHLYIRRPRSWYDWVMLDTYRNEIASALIKSFRFATGQSCGTSHFYSGTKIELELNFTDFKLSVELDERDQLHIGIKDNDLLNPTLLQFKNTGILSGWIVSKTFNCSGIRSPQKVTELISTIKNLVFHTNKDEDILMSFADDIDKTF